MELGFAAVIVGEVVKPLVERCWLIKQWNHKCLLQTKSQNNFLKEYLIKKSPEVDANIPCTNYILCGLPIIK